MMVGPRLSSWELTLKSLGQVADNVLVSDSNIVILWKTEKRRSLPIQVLAPNRSLGREGDPNIISLST